MKFHVVSCFLYKEVSFAAVKFEANRHAKNISNPWVHSLGLKSSGPHRSSSHSLAKWMALGEKIFDMKALELMTFSETLQSEHRAIIRMLQLFFFFFLM